MHPIVLFDRIMIEAPRKRIYRRLGYRPGVTSLPAGQEAEVERNIADALTLINLRGTGRRFTMRGQQDAQVRLDGQTGEEVFHSRQLAAFLQECDEVVLLGATAGNEVMAAIAADVTGDRLTRGVVIDAVASEMVDASLDAGIRPAMAILGSKIRPRCFVSLTFRVSGCRLPRVFYSYRRNQ
jgi:hypothetical protein